MNVAIIPARGGSKRIPRKNIKIFNGKPMIGWSIEAAKKSEIFDKIIVSTDDEEIAEISEKFGAQVPFFRPKKLSDDFTGTTEVIKHAIKFLIENGNDIEFACCIYAIAPLIDALDIKNSFSVINKSKWSYVFSVSDYSTNIYRSFTTNSDGGIRMIFPKNFTTRSQDLPKSLFDAGQFYWGKVDSWINEIKIFDKNSYPYVLPNWRVCDIDTIEDWKRLEIIKKILTENKQ
jgi:pseudaminic acid cytidylyltransferase